jgi:hypothetical protein
MGGGENCVLGTQGGRESKRKEKTRRKRDRRGGDTEREGQRIRRGLETLNWKGERYLERYSQKCKKRKRPRKGWQTIGERKSAREKGTYNLRREETKREWNIENRRRGKTEDTE